MVLAFVSFPPYTSENTEEVELKAARSKSLPLYAAISALSVVFLALLFLVLPGVAGTTAVSGTVSGAASGSAGQASPAIWVAPVPGFYGALALGLSGLLVALVRRGQRVLGTPKANHR